MAETALFELRQLIKNNARRPRSAHMIGTIGQKNSPARVSQAG
jgi:hypothetical protein